MNTYIATNTLNGKFYIGSSKNFEQRKKEHLGSKANYPFQNDLRKSPEIFEWDVHSDEYEEPVLEQALLDMYFNTEQCYNLNPLAEHPPNQVGRSRWKNESHQKEKTCFNKPEGEGWEPGRLQKNKCAVGLANSGEKSPFFGKLGEDHHSSKPVVVTKPDGTRLRFGSGRETGRELGINQGDLVKLIKNNRSPKKGKFKGWRFVYENQ